MPTPSAATPPPNGSGQQQQQQQTPAGAAIAKIKEENSDGVITGTVGDDSRHSVSGTDQRRRSSTNNPKRRKISDRSAVSGASSGDYIEIDVRGRRHSLLVSELEARPPTLLSKRLDDQQGEGGVVELNEVQPELFQYVLGWYARGQITIPIEVTEDSIRHECRKLGLPSDVPVKFDTGSMQSISKAVVANTTAIVQAPEKTAKLLVAQEIFKFVYTNMWKNLKSEQVANMAKEGWSKTLPKLRLVIEDFSEKDWRDVMRLMPAKLAPNHAYLRSFPVVLHVSKTALPKKWPSITEDASRKARISICGPQKILSEIATLKDSVYKVLEGKAAKRFKRDFVSAVKSISPNFRVCWRSNQNTSTCLYVQEIGVDAVLLEDNVDEIIKWVDDDYDGWTLTIWSKSAQDDAPEALSGMSIPTPRPDLLVN
ncbi:potassium channel tetramerization domain containing [Perkinsus olseni]|uniref:Potassium channel tetramerization domain containing n=1 Tax=Perkinsus olseni TaxID=32597 RepID=A0A7J6NWI4_PEROL|nr:potassium channel tetramerization domain containing [Perkinsus olseni]